MNLFKRTGRFLKGEPVKEIPIYATMNVHLMVLDTFLIVQTRNEKFFKVFSTHSYQLLGEFGEEGDGPSDFRFPYLSKEIWHSGERPKLNQIYDSHLNRHYPVSIPEVLEGGAFAGKPLREVNNHVKHFYFKNEEYLWSTTEDAGRFFHHDDITGNSTVIPYIPKVDFSIEDEEDLYMVYRSAVIGNN